MKRAAITILVCMLLTACGEQVAVVTPEMQAAMMSQLRSGQADLDCWIACSGTWGGDLSELNKRYIVGDWTGLGTLVMQIGFQSDLAYYYLGRSAEGLGAPEAALRYYRISGALATGADRRYKCFGVFNLCNGLSFPQDLYPRIQVVENEINRSRPVVARKPAPKPKPTIASASNNASPSAPAKQPAPTVAPASAPAQDEAWIDPPPVTH